MNLMLVDGFRVLVIGYLLAVIVVDWRQRKIPNTLSISAIVIGLAFWSFESGWHGVLFSGLGLVVGFITLLIPFLMGGIGGGDVKFLAATGALLGMVDFFWGFLIGAIIAGAVAWVIFIHHPLAYGPKYSMKSFGLLKENETTGKWFFPFGVPVALGMICYLIFG